MCQIYHIPKRFMGDPRDPQVTDHYPTPSAVELAKAQMLCERGRALESATTDGDTDRLLRGMDKPSVQRLQMDESLRMNLVAQEAALALYDIPLKLLPPETRTRLRDGAAVLLRSQHEAWRSKAVNEAALVLTDALVSEMSRALPQLSRPHWYGLACRLAGLALAKERDVYLTSQDDRAMPVGQYLTLSGLSMAEDAEVKRQVEEA